MLKEMPELLAPENKRTGIEIRPKVRYPDQTDAAMVLSVRATAPEPCQSRSLDYNDLLWMQEPAAVTELGSLTYGVPEPGSPLLVLAVWVRMVDSRALRCDFGHARI